MDAKKEMENKLHLIRLRFVQRLDDWIPEYTNFLLELKEKNITRENILTIRAEVHKIVGTSSTLGFLDIGRAAKLAESTLSDLISTPEFNHPSPEALTNLKSLMIQLNRFAFLSSAKNIPALLAENKNEAENDQNKKIGNYDFNIVVAEDDELLRELIKNVFIEANCRILPVGDGKQVLRLLRKAEINNKLGMIDLILLDVNMPEMNGIEVLKIVKNSRLAKIIPVVMLSSKSDDEDILRAMSSGAVDFIAKPFRIEELNQRLMKFLQKRETGVLIADDNELRRELLFRKFYRAGHRVFISDNTEKAKFAIEHEIPGVVLLSSSLPEKGGAELVKFMLGKEEMKKTPVLLLGNNSDYEQVQAGLEAGAEDFVMNTFDLKEINLRVKRVLGNTARKTTMP